MVIFEFDLLVKGEKSSTDSCVVIIECVSGSCNILLDFLLNILCADSDERYWKAWCKPLFSLECIIIIKWIKYKARGEEEKE